MNQYAARLGMNNSHFADASGLPDPNHYTTARDLTILARALIHDFPDWYKIFAERDFTSNQIPQPNRNGLLDKDQIGRESCRDSGCQYVLSQVVAGSLNTK